MRPIREYPASRMGEPEFTNLLIIVAIGFAAPFAARTRAEAPASGRRAGDPRRDRGRPIGLGWVEVDESVEVVAVIGLAFLLFLAGLEIDFDRLRGRLLRLAAGGYALSFAISVAVALALERAAGWSRRRCSSRSSSAPRRSA